MIHIYTGKGKGKTTAATGLMIRALGNGMSPILLRFLKKSESSEDKILKELGIPVEKFGAGFITDKTIKENTELARKGLKKFKQIVKENRYNPVVLDEINIVLNKEIIDTDKFIKLLNEVPESLEVILTGRNAPKKLILEADLVTEMIDVKHYYKKGTPARKGIEY